MLPSTPSPSRLLHELTNSSLRPPIKNAPLSPRDSGRAAKRRRVDGDCGSEPSTPTRRREKCLLTRDQKEDEDSLLNLRTPLATRLPFRRTERHPPISRQNHYLTPSLAQKYNPQSLSLRPILQSFASSSQSDTYRVHAPEDSFQTYCTPFVSSFSNAAKRGLSHVIVVGTQEGSLEIIDTKPRQHGEFVPQTTTIVAHTNSIFDARWSDDDRYIATSSGDRSSAIVDVVARRPVAILSAHALTVKSTLWNPSNPSLLASASRDGDIHFWDLRVAPPNGELTLKPVFSIQGAHQDASKGIPVKGRSKTKPTTPVRSVTSIAYLPNREHCLISGGSGDGILKIWDSRYPKESKLSKSRLSTSATDVDTIPFDPTYDPTILKPNSNGDLVPHVGPRSRARGISSIALDPISGNCAWALARNGCIYTYRLNQIFCASSPNDIPLPVTHPCLQVGSFYPRLALSPCGRFLAAGSSNGRLVLWDAKSLLTPGITTKEAAVVLDAHTAEVSGVDWSYDNLLSSSDDCMVRVWRKD